MVGTMLDYLKEYGEYSFLEKPINEVDSLVLCQFSYLKFDGLVPLVTENKKSVGMKYIKEHADYEKLYADERYEKDNRDLFTAMYASKRFQTLKLNCYVNIILTEQETQFSAVTFLLEDGTIYVAYRGTDETIVGWKEDFNMAFLDPVPGQSYSVKYLNMVTGRLKQNFYIGGHSKGGNLAVYAALNCVPRVQERIIKIYNHDGPGFRPEVLARFDYTNIEHKIVRILPHSSLVGMLFMPVDEKYKTIESKTFGLFQHNPYTWLVDEDHFVEAKDIYKGRKFSDGTINEWVLSLEADQLKTFVDTLYQVISASKADTLIDFSADWKKSVTNMLMALKEVDEDTKKVIKQVIKTLFNMMGERMRAELTEKNRG